MWQAWNANKNIITEYNFFVDITEEREWREIIQLHSVKLISQRSMVKWWNDSNMYAVLSNKNYPLLSFRKVVYCDKIAHHVWLGNIIYRHQMTSFDCLFQLWMNQYYMIMPCKYLYILKITQRQLCLVALVLLIDVSTIDSKLSWMLQSPCYFMFSLHYGCKFHFCPLLVCSCCTIIPYIP